MRKVPPLQIFQFCCWALLCAGLMVPAATRAQGVGRSPGGRSMSGPPGGRGPGGSGGMSGGYGNGPGGSQFRNNVTTRTGIKLGPPGRWWDDRATIRTLDLSKTQQKKMDSIFDAYKPAIIQSYQAYANQKTTLDSLSKAPQVDKPRMLAAIDSVNQARAALEKVNTQMLLDVRQELNPEQVAKLDSLP